MRFNKNIKYLYCKKSLSYESFYFSDDTCKDLIRVERKRFIKGTKYKVIDYSYNNIRDYYLVRIEDENGKKAHFYDNVKNLSKNKDTLYDYFEIIVERRKRIIDEI